MKTVWVNEIWETFVKKLKQRKILVIWTWVYFYIVHHLMYRKKVDNGILIKHLCVFSKPCLTFSVDLCKTKIIKIFAMTSLRLLWWYFCFCQPVWSMNLVRVRHSFQYFKVSYQWKVQDNGSRLHFIASIIPFGQCSIDIRKSIKPNHPLMTRSLWDSADGLLRVVCLKIVKMKTKW